MPSAKVKSGTGKSRSLKKNTHASRSAGKPKPKNKNVAKKIVKAKKVNKKSPAKKIVAKKKIAAVKKKAVVKSALRKTAAKAKALKKLAVKKAGSKKESLKKKLAVKKAVQKITRKKVSKSAVSRSGVSGRSHTARISSKISSSDTATIKPKIRKKPKNSKTKYTVSELKHFRDIIIKEQRAILESARANMEALVDNESGEYKGDNLTYASHMAEQGTDEMEREKNYMFVQRDEKYLGYLQDALMRIDQGTYGICIDCKDEPKNLCRTCPLIPKERLEVVPVTTHCIECKNLRSTH